MLSVNNVDRDQPEQNTQHIVTEETRPVGRLFPLSLTLNVIEGLQEYFLVDTVEDKQRVRSIIEILSNCNALHDWQTEIEEQLRQLKRLLAEGKPLLQIAAELKVPIDELEKFCESTSNLLLRNRSKELDSDLLMYGRIRSGLMKKEARRLAYEHLKNIEAFKGKSWAMRMILGVNRKHFQELQDFAHSYGNIQPGLGAIRPSGETKHELNRILCQTFSNVTEYRPLVIFEPTQGYGEATTIFSTYGLVISLEKNSKQYARAFEAHKYHSVDLLECLREGWSLEELVARVKNEQNFRVLMPSRAIDAHIIIPQIRQASWSFDIIDVDPFYQAHIYEMVDTAFPLLADISLLFVSVNPSPRYGRSKEIADRYGQKDTPEFRERLWMFDCWRYMWKAYEQGFTLIPIVVHKCWTAIEQSGIDRLYFVAAKLSKGKRNGVLREYLDGSILRQSKTSSIIQYQDGTVPVLYFGLDVGEENPTSIPNADIISLRLKNIVTQLLAL